MSGIQVKSYLFPEQVKPTLAAVSDVEEIRRFNLSLDIGKSGLYHSLIDKIQQAYGALLPNKEEIRTYWQDDEDELIGFTSDSELQYAIDVITTLKMGTPYEKNIVFKVFVARKSAPNRSQQSQERKWECPQIHFGVVCDNCEGSVIGIRYKCSVCPDFDLCEECNGKNVHKEHAMNKIARPIGLFCQGGRRGAWKNRGGACGAKGTNEKRCHQNGPFHQFMKDLGGLPQFAASNVPFVNDPEQLKNFGENLKRILDPLGIDVSYYVDGMTKAGKDQPKTDEATKTEAKKKEHEAKTSTSSTTTTTTTTTTTLKAPKVEIIRRSESIMDETEPLVVDSTEPIVTSKNTSSIQIEKASTSTTEESKKTPVETAELIDLSKSVNPMAPYESAINALKTVSAAYESVESQGPSAPAVDSMMVDDFNLVDIENELKIIKTIETLKTMGYSDDGGWLTRLVSAKAGNINKVLDAISPNKSQ